MVSDDELGVLAGTVNSMRHGFAERLLEQGDDLFRGERRDVTVMFDLHGHVNKSLGDGAMAVFGAPNLLSDHADQTTAAARKLEYTLIGDAVNVAARVEQLTKTTGDVVLVTQQTVDTVRRHETFARLVATKDDSTVDIEQIGAGRTSAAMADAFDKLGRLRDHEIPTDDPTAIRRVFAVVMDLAHRVSGPPRGHR